ncbi:DMT family transporter [Paenibacillus sp. LPE1-1-1.1]|uniref:DMT family transporter n=1 Tax=Paenibacillus sp. LPE1-1-1.1 TaxID=3135230 RepID=UPI0034240A19
MNRSWILTFVGVVFEVVWVSGFKHADGPLLWMISIASLIISFTLVLIAAVKLPVGTVYAVYTGLGTAGTVLVEMMIFNEPVLAFKLLLIVLLLAGVMGLKLFTSSPASKEAEQ